MVVKLMSVGSVTFWKKTDGWGVIESEDTPGGCWAHFSVIDMKGFHELSPGQEVYFEWEPSTNIDGYRFNALKIQPAGGEDP